MSEVGYKKPPKNRQFGQPDGNPQVATSAQRKMEIENARIATEIRQRALHAVHAKLVECSTDDAIALLVEAAMLKLLKDTEDRGLGTPKASLDLSSDDGSMSPKPAVELTDEQLAMIIAGHADKG
jgi:hypothetical protein